MPEIFAVLSTIAHAVGYVGFAGMLLVICMPILASLILAIAYTVMVCRGEGSRVTDDDDGEEIA